MMTTLTCPEVQLLQQFLVGRLSEAEAAAVEQHIAQCGRCLETLQALPKEDTLVQEMRVHAPALDEPTNEVIEGLAARFSQLPENLAAPPTEKTVAASGAPLSGEETLAAERAVPPSNATEEIYDFLAPAQGPGEIGRLGQYRILKVLGRGGMGFVFQAEDVQLQRLVALKVILPSLAASAAVKKRFLREARAMAAVEHDHIAPIFQVGEERGTPFLAMPLLKGESLDDRLQREGRLPTADVLRICREMAEGLAAAHEHGLVHRDVKPSNVWLEGKRGRVKVLDFGLALAVEGDAQTSQSGLIAGTPAYMAPEQAAGETVDARTDLFSLGCVIYRMATGQAPFKGASTMAVLRSLAIDTPRPPRELNPDLPPALSDLVVMLLSKDRAGRPASATAVAEMLEAIGRETAPAEIRTALPASGPSPAGLPDTMLERPAPAPAKRSWIRWGWAAVAAAILMLGAAGYLCGPAVYRLATNQGQLVIEVNDKNIEVLLTDQGVKVRDATTHLEYVLKPGSQGLPAGEYVIDVTEEAGGLHFSTKEFTITRNGTADVKVTLEKTPAVPPAVPVAVKVPTLEELAKRPSAADALRREDIPAAALTWAGFGDPKKAPAELVAVLGDARFRFIDLPSFPAYSPDGKLLAVPSGSQVMIFDAETGQYRRTLVGHTGRAFCVAFNPDGQMLASGSDDHTVKLWEVATGREIRTLCGQTGNVHCLAFSPDGQTLASGGNDHTVRLWQVAKGEQRSLLRGGADEEWWSLAFDPKGGLLAAGEEHGAVKVWDTADGVLRHEYRHAQPSFTQVAFSPDGKVLASGNDVEVRLWDAATFKERAAIPTRASGLLAFAPDSRSLLTGLHFHDTGVIPTVTRWELDTGKELAALKLEDEQDWVHYRLSPDGQTLAAASSTQRIVRLYDAATGRPRFPSSGHAGAALAVAFSPDGKTVASGGLDRKVKLWDAATGKELRTLSGHTDLVFFVAFSPDGKTVAAGGMDQTVILWDAASGQRWRTLVGPNGPTEQLAFSPDGRLLAAASWDKAVYLWDVASGRQVKALQGHSNQVHAVAFGPDGQTLASADVDGAMKLWDVASGQEKLNWRHSAGIQRLAFFPDGQTLAGADAQGLVTRWSAVSGTRRPPLTGPAPASVRGLSVRADGRMLAVCGVDGTVRLWDLTADPPSGRVWRLLPRYSWVSDVAFSPEGRYLAAAGDDGLVRILRAPEHVRGEPPPAPSTPFRVDLNGLAGRQSMDATAFPPSWRKDGVFAAVKGPGEATFPSVPVTRYVCEADVEILAVKGSALHIRTGEADICLDLDNKEEMVKCHLFNWHSGVAWYMGDRRFNLREHLRFKLVVVDERRCLLANDVPILSIDGQPADLALRILSDGQPSATVYRCSCRPVEDDDLRALNWPLPPAKLVLDADAAAKRFKERTAGLDNKPVEGKRFVVGATGGPLTWIAPGEFDLGSRDPKAPEGTRKHHTRLTKGFWMGQYVVTQGEWAKLMPANPSRFQGSPYLPVDSVRWEDAMRFGKQLTDREKADGRLPEGYEYRLPTEAEWEYAARAGSDEESNVSPEQSWTELTSTQQAHEVGAWPPTPWGLYDMQGNVREWCYDAWYSYPEPVAGTAENPVHFGDPATSEFVVRGGAWWLRREWSGISARDRTPSSGGAGYGGFRIVLGPVLRKD